MLRRYLPRGRAGQEPDPERAFAGVFRGAEAKAPLQGRGGRRLSEAFRFAAGGRRTERRSALDMKRTGFRLPGLLAEAAKAVERRQEPTLTELITRYLALHVHLSERA